MALYSKTMDSSMELLQMGHPNEAQHNVEKRKTMESCSFNVKTIALSISLITMLCFISVLGIQYFTLRAKVEEFNPKTNEKVLNLTRLINYILVNHTDHLTNASNRLSRYRNESEAMNKILDKETEEKIDEILESLSNHSANIDLLETRIDGHKNVPGKLLELEEGLKNINSQLEHLIETVPRSVKILIHRARLNTFSELIGRWSPGLVWKCYSKCFWKRYSKTREKTLGLKSLSF